RLLHPDKGGFKLVTTILSDEAVSFTLESPARYFPGNSFLGWLESEKIEFSVRVANLNAKNS
ncbi:MAG TPA: hypothetical protein P5533_07610, partial [Candidatus Cloacimonadota bacterium]|nr:hypothetical protein [Candidatus Cloacimonadota bacterium]